MVVFILLSLSGTTAISYCFRFPPKVFTSATPFVPINWGFIIQSWMVLKSVALYFSSYPFLGNTTYWYISPKPVLTGAISGVPTPFGMVFSASLIRSVICALAQ